MTGLITRKLIPVAKETLSEHYDVDENGCWVCKDRFIDKDGYPRCNYKKKTMLAAKWVWVDNFGEPPNGMVVKHSCDNRLCVNPDHLSLGTQGANIQDRVLRGRSARGGDNGRAKLSEKDVRYIKYHSDSSNSVLAMEFGVEASTIRLIKKGINWSHI